MKKSFILNILNKENNQANKKFNWKKIIITFVKITLGRFLMTFYIISMHLIQNSYFRDKVYFQKIYKFTILEDKKDKNNIEVFMH